MTGWIGELLEKRVQLNPADQTVASAAQKELENQRDAGVVLVTDIGNEFRDHSASGSTLPKVLELHEVLAPTAARTCEVLSEIESLPLDCQVTPHAPYSTSPQLIQAVKQRCTTYSHLFSIHTAESYDEIDFIRQKIGPFRTFLEKRGMWDGILAEKGNHKGTVAYLDDLGVLDDRTLCVHCVHVSDEEIDILARRGAKVCLCPGSNEFLGVGRAPLENMLAAGLLPAVGTDSITSNESLDLWRELGILRNTFPAVGASILLHMATLGGAGALGCEKNFGSLEKGKKAVFLQVNSATLPDTAGGVEEQLVAGKRPENINWITG